MASVRFKRASWRRQRVRSARLDALQNGHSFDLRFMRFPIGRLLLHIRCLAERVLKERGLFVVRPVEGENKPKVYYDALSFGTFVADASRGMGR